MIELREFNKLFPRYVKGMYETRNDCRQFLKNDKEIREPDVVNFFLTKIKPGNEKIYMIFYEDEILGYVNAIPLDENKCEVGIKIKTTHRGNGFGKQALALLIGKLEGKELIAEIKTTNEASKKLFASQGFKPLKINEEEGIETWQLSKK